MGMNTPLSIGTKVRIVKGCKARQVAKGSHATVTGIVEMGAEHGHFVKLVMSFSGVSKVFYVRHKNRLDDIMINLHDGNPLHKVTVTRCE